MTNNKYFKLNEEKQRLHKGGNKTAIFLNLEMIDRRI